MSDIWIVCLQIYMVKYDANWEITNIYENLQIVWSQFCTDMLLFIYIRSTLNIYWFIDIRIRCQQIQTNSYLVTFGYSQYLVQHSMNNPEGKKTTICHYLIVIYHECLGMRLAMIWKLWYHVNAVGYHLTSYQNVSRYKVRYLGLTLSFLLGRWI